MGLREEKKAATRLALHEAATALVTQRPWDQISIDDIADAAGVSRRTFFNYFTTKEEVLVSGVDDQPERIVAAARAAPVGLMPWQVLKKGLLSGVPVKEPEAMRLIVEIRQQPEFVVRSFTMRAYLERALAEELLQRNPDWHDSDAQLCVAIFLTAARVAGGRWLAGPGGRTLEQVLDEVLALVVFTPGKEG